jgi:hypothetical protein
VHVLDACHVTQHVNQWEVDGVEVQALDSLNCALRAGVRIVSPFITVLPVVGSMTNKADDGLPSPMEWAESHGADPREAEFCGRPGHVHLGGCEADSEEVVKRIVDAELIQQRFASSEALI